MSYGAGASVPIWRAVLPMAERWEAEFDEACVRSTRDAGKIPPDVRVVTGDQGNHSTLARWVAETRGADEPFDVLIDDGGHYNWQITNSFEALWPTLRRGGVYYLEDLHEGRTSRYSSAFLATKRTNAVEFDWAERDRRDPRGRPRWRLDVTADWTQALADHVLRGGDAAAERPKTPVPYEIENTLDAAAPAPGASFVLCQAEARAIGKE